MVCVALFATGCLLDRTGAARLEGGPQDVDATLPDGGRGDGGPGDGGPGDAGRDAGRDAGDVDGGVDAGMPDAGMVCPDAGVPPALTVWARPASAIVVDGDLSDWDMSDAVAIAAPAGFVGGPPASGAADLSARLSARWRADAVFFAIEVTDDTHHGGDAGELLWRGDSVQVAFDVADNGGTGYDSTDDFEYGWTLSDAGPVEWWRWAAPAVAAPSVQRAGIVRAGNTTRYEIALAASDLGSAVLVVGTTMGMSFLVNENDSGGQDREGYLEWSTGIGAGKNPGAFGALILRGPACP